MAQIHFKKNISLFSLLMTGVTTIVGSGWLLGTQKIAEVAGPAGLISWVVGVCVIVCVALFYLEIGIRYPSAGGIGYYSTVTHGHFCGFLTSWINWLSIVAVPPIEAQAVAQYLSSIPHLALLYAPAQHTLSVIGIACAMVLLVIFMLINYWSVQFFIRFNNIFTIIKVIVPIITIICLSYQGLHFNNFNAYAGGFTPFGWKGVLSCVVSCGVIMSFNGFQSPLTFSEEIRSPKKMLPIAVLGSIFIAFVLYFFLQATFIGSISPNMLAAGWEHINFRSPYVELLLLANFHIVVLSVYMASVISPIACGSGFLASSARIMYSLSSGKYLPKYLSSLDTRYHNPRHAVVTCTIVGCLILLVFRGWYDLVAVISVLHVFSYIPAPIVALTNRRQHTDHHNQQQFLVPFAAVLSPLLLFILSILLFYAAWPLTIKMLFFIVPGLCFYGYYEFRFHKRDNFMANLKGASWLIFYLIGVTLITYLGQNSNHAVNIISTPESMILLAVLSLVICWYGIYIAPPKEGLQAPHLKHTATH